jgi:hypothetical protein
MQTFYEAALYVLLELLSLLWSCLQRYCAEEELLKKKVAQLRMEEGTLSIELQKEVEVSSILLLSG